MLNVFQLFKKREIKENLEKRGVVPGANEV